MAARRPAKIATTKKAKMQKICPVTNKPMTPVKFFGHSRSNGMYWVVLEDFDGSPKSYERMIPTS